MERQIFINEMQARFNLRKPRSEKPTNLYLVCRINNKQVKLSTGVKIYPDHWNEKRQEAYISVRLSELDNINNTIVNKKITKLKEYFIEFKHYLCMHPDEIGESMKLLKQHIYKDRMKKELQKPIIPAIKRMVVLPNHIRQFIRAISPLALPVFAKNLYGSEIIPICIKIELIGPPSENSVKNNMENADAMIRFGR